MRSVQPADFVDLRALACPRCGATPRDATLGFKVVRDREVLGFLALAPSDAVGVLPRGSMLVEQLWVRQDDVGELIGTQLLQRAAGALHARGVRCLVARGTLGVSDCRHLPGAWLEHVGFVVQVRGVQWRLDLRRTLPVPDAVRAAWAAAGGVLRPGRATPATGRLTARWDDGRPPARG